MCSQGCGSLGGWGGSGRAAPEKTERSAVAASVVRRLALRARRRWRGLRARAPAAAGSLPPIKPHRQASPVIAGGGGIVLVLGVGRCAFRPPRVVFVLRPCVFSKFSHFWQKTKQHL